MNFVTNFGDSAVLIPFSIVILVWFSSRRQSFLSAVWWCAALALCGGVISASKVIFYACPPAANLDSPSGHTAFSLLAYGGFAIIVGAEQPSPWRRGAAALAALSLAVGIAASRVILHMHTTLEAVVGFAIGLAALAVFAFGYRLTRVAGRPLASLIVPALLVLVLFHGDRMTPEDTLHHFGDWLNIRSLVCPSQPE